MPAARQPVNRRSPQADRSVAHARVVLGQQVAGEVAAQVAPHGVDVVGPVLGPSSTAALRH